MLGDYSGVGYAQERHVWYYLDIPLKDLIDENGSFGFVYDFSAPIAGKVFTCGFDIQEADVKSSVTTYTQGAEDPDTGMYEITVTELKSAMAVDTHIFRVSHRLGLVPASCTTPYAVEKELTRHLPAEVIPRAHHWLLLHGRYTCQARTPKCGQCGLADICKNART